MLLAMFHEKYRVKVCIFQHNGGRIDAIVEDEKYI